MGVPYNGNLEEEEDEEEDEEEEEEEGEDGDTSTTSGKTRRAFVIAVQLAQRWHSVVMHLLRCLRPLARRVLLPFSSPSRHRPMGAGKPLPVVHRVGHSLTGHRAPYSATWI